MAKPIQSVQQNSVKTYSQLTPEQQSDCLKACAQLTDVIYPGLDLSREIVVVQAQHLGDTILMEDEIGLAGLAICHCGAASEAGSSAGILPASETLVMGIQKCDALVSEPHGLNFSKINL